MFFLFPQFLIERGKINIFFHKPDLSAENYYKSPFNTVKVQPKVSLTFFFFFLHLDEAVI